MQEDTDDIIFNQLCSINGIDISNNSNELKKTVKLEVFFGGISRLCCLNCFPNLSELVIIDQPIKRIEQLESCTNLVSLWICECQITEIEGLDHCGQLRHLYLYDNRISRIRNLESVKLLETLWLNDNIIETIEGLRHLQILDCLNLAGNKITSLGNSLSQNISLTDLILSGNNLNDIDDVINLSKLPKLKHLSLNGPDYSSNPLFYHPNYFLYVLYHLPNIHKLDSYEITNQNCLKDIVTSIVSKKRLFYTMKLEIIQRNMRFAQQKLIQTQNNCIKHLQQKIKWRIRLKMMISTLKSNNNILQNQAQVLEQIDEDLKQLNFTLERIDKEVNWYCKDYLEKYTEEIKQFYQVELGSCGNFKFELCLKGDKLTVDNSWFKLCCDLLSARFCKLEALNTTISPAYRVSSLVTHRVVKLKNYLLDKRYMDLTKKLRQMNSEVDSEADTWEDYLFLSVNCLDKNESLLDTIKRIYSTKYPDNLFKLTNSLFAGDLKRGEPQNFPHQYGRVILVKCFIRYAELVDTLPPYNANSSKSLNNNKVYKIPFTDCVNYQCNCSQHKFHWYFRGSGLLVPDYVIDFEYITNNPGFYSPIYYTNHQQSIDNHNFYLQQTPILLADSQLDELTDQLKFDDYVAQQIIFMNEIKSVGSHDDFKQLSTLNLTNCQLKHLSGLGKLEQLEELIVAFNQIVSLNDVKNPQLKYLDVSYNKIQSLDGMQDFFNLKVFLLQQNFLSKNREESNTIVNQTPNLTEVNYDGNLFQKTEAMRLLLISRLKFLKMLNGKLVSSSEVDVALQTILQARITDALLYDNARLDTIKPRSLLLDNTGGIINAISEELLCKFNGGGSDINPSKFMKITSLYLAGLKLYRITNLDMLENLKFLELSNNNLSKIEGIQQCLHLEELILDGNILMKLDNLSRLGKLRKLSINDNFIVSLTGLRGLTNLECFSASTNRIVSLSGLEQSPVLSELYLGNNFVGEHSDIYYLKSLGNLIVLDLFNNPIVENSRSYRLNMIFHLRQLKALDGQCIEPGEVQQAKDLLGGRLNLDYIREKIHDDNYERLVELDFNSCLLKSVDLAPVDKLQNLKSLNLENNNLSSFSGLIFLKNLKVLCLNNNCIDSILPKSNSKGITSSVQPITESKPRVELRALEVLHLGYNHIKSIGHLGLCDLPNIKALFLQGNDISVIDGLDNLRELREIVLDQNRIKSIGDSSFLHNSKLQEIHLDDNRVKNISGIFHLKGCLKRLYLGNNKLMELRELDQFYLLENLIDVSLHGNAICRRNHHRYYLMHLLPGLLMIDGIEVTEDEKYRLEATLEDHYGDSSSTNILPGIINSNRLIYTRAPDVNSSTGSIITTSAITTSSSSTATLNVNSTSIGSTNNISKLDGAANYHNALKKQHRSSSINTVALNKNNLQLVANSKAVYFYDPTGQIESVPRLYFNKRK